jgi:hypothetical protein
MTDTAVLFAGHRIDEPGRTPPRFPSECETRARAAIQSVMRSIAETAFGPVLGIAGAADGGDILFHEVCAELGIRSEVCLALPVAEYAHASVRTSWTDRFHCLLQTHSSTILEPGCGDVWLRDHEWQLRRARELNPRRTVLLALLEEVEADIPGGTSGMVRLGQDSGLEVIRLNVRTICT